jgi:hypothetical protein
MQEITLDELYYKWQDYKLKKRIEFFKSYLIFGKKKLYTFSEYHTWILKEGKYKVV